MNKKIFSLHDQSKTSGLRNRIVRVIKKINGSSKNVIGSKCETQLNNNNNNYYQNDIDAYTDKRYAECIECCCGCLFIDGVCD
ncbi:hypothetical protein YYG_05148 [Plasmodium vinckei petteri]|uniref:PYST-C1-like N-terminal domain-containing protein n=1 Tax=Plasmodium vinckei petteri TaxID=138298 RepID=W7A8T5_PLAVN|nr:hypothetical protein YYG_05148 [Plasmodium vinckei petteri]